MTNEHDNLDKFRDAYLDYLEGDLDKPPALDDLTEIQRRTAEGFIESIEAARGVDPYASRPTIERLLASRTQDEHGIDAIGESLESQLKVDVDPKARVVADVAADAIGLASELVISARGIRMRAVMEPPSTDLDVAFSNRVGDIAAIFGAFPDTIAVLYATTGVEALGVILDRGDVYRAIETPSGAIRAPRLRWPITGVATACAMWLRNAIPTFEPINASLLEASLSYDSPLDPDLLAARVVGEISAAGARARIQAKKDAWSALGESEAQSLAAVVDDAQQRPLSGEEYRHRLADIVGTAA